jgi:hypothetical protein
MVISKDLNRLNDEHASYAYSRLNWQHHQRKQDTSTSTSENEETVPTIQHALDQRRDMLTRILHTYAKETEYQQGMHELCSYILLVMEMDIFDCETSPSDGHDHYELLQSQHIVVDTYSLFVALMNNMTMCYNGSLEAMGQSIRGKLCYVSEHADQLYLGLQGLPLELYCARWMRLLFAREVEGGYQCVLQMWDRFLNLMGQQWTLMEVLEVVAACIMWKERTTLLQEESMDQGFQKLLQHGTMDDIIDPLMTTVVVVLQRWSSGDVIIRDLAARPRSQQRRSSWSTAIDHAIEETQCILKESPFSTGIATMFNGQIPQVQQRRSRSAAIDHAIDETQCILKESLSTGIATTMFNGEGEQMELELTTTTREDVMPGHRAAPRRASCG